MFQDGGTRKLEKAKISLDDCLACSGCVTSAETVLITQQSHEELRKVLDANKVSGGRASRLCFNPASTPSIRVVKGGSSSGATYPVSPGDSHIFKSRQWDDCHSEFLVSILILKCWA